MPSATPRRQSSHRRRRSTNRNTNNRNTNQPNPPRAQARRSGNTGYHQPTGNSGTTQVPGKAAGGNAKGVTRGPQVNTIPNSTANMPTPPLPPLEIERATDTSAAPAHHVVEETPPPTTRPAIDQPGAVHLEGSRTAPQALSPQQGGALIPPLPTATALPRSPLPPANTQPAPSTLAASAQPTPPAPSPQRSQQIRSGGEATERQRHAHRGQRRRRRAPNVRAALGYAVPFAPALWLLARERRARFVRLHAAQSLVFFGLLALGQVALFVALVSLGAINANLNVSLVLGLVFLLLFGMLGVGGFGLWLLLLGDAMAGRLRSYPYLSKLATLIEHGATRLQMRFERGDGFRSRATR